MQGVGVAARRRRELVDPGRAGGEVLGDPKGRHHVDAPGRAQIAQRPQVHALPQPGPVVHRGSSFLHLDLLTVL